MSDEMQSHHTPAGHRSFFTSRAGLVTLGFLAIGGALLFTEHRAHVLGALPYLLLLACPFMHFFMHGGHGGHHHHHGSEGDTPRQAPREGEPK